MANFNSNISRPINPRRQRRKDQKRRGKQDPVEAGTIGRARVGEIPACSSLRDLGGYYCAPCKKPYINQYRDPHWTPVKTYKPKPRRRAELEA